MNELETDMSEAVISCYKHSCSFLTIDYDPDDNERILITPRSADCPPHYGTTTAAASKPR